MKNKIIIIVLLLLNCSLLFSQVAINTDGSDPDNSAIFDVKSTSRGFLPPRMTQAERNAISVPADGLLVFCTDCGSGSLGTLTMFMAGQWYKFSANCVVQITPGTHVASPTQIVWNWSTVTGATGYKWNTANDYAAAIDMGTATTKTETGLTCNTAYTSYAWAYKACGVSTPVTLLKTTSLCPVPPTVSTAAVSNITQTTATSGGNVTADGGAMVTARGVCWGTSSNPTIAGMHTTNGSGTGQFVSDLTGLTANTPYYLKAYATNGMGTAYGNEVSFTTSPVFSIGLSYGGGIIFYIDGTGQHGLIAAITDQGYVIWGCSGTLIGTSNLIGTGQANTTAIVNGCGESGTAARICNDLVLNGYSDWFLPSQDELNQMCLQKNVIGGFGVHSFWSSSEYSASHGLYQFFADGWNCEQDYRGKTFNYYVRAVRAF